MHCTFLQWNISRMTVICGYAREINGCFPINCSASLSFFLPPGLCYVLTLFRRSLAWCDPTLPYPTPSLPIPTLPYPTLPCPTLLCSTLLCSTLLAMEYMKNRKCKSSILRFFWSSTTSKLYPICFFV